MYVKRNAQGEIVAVSRSPEPEVGEWAEESQPDLVAFLASAQSGDFIASDLEMARVLEDLVYLLIDRQVIRVTDLPHAAQQKLNTRSQMRRNQDAVDLLDDSDDMPV